MQTATRKRDDVSHSPDEHLVALALRGEGSAFRAIIQRYNRRLYRIARGIVRDDGEAEDILQDAYVRAFAALSQFHGNASLSTWLTRIVLNEALGRLRRQRRTVTLDVLDQAAHQGDSHVIMFPGVSVAPDPESAAARAEVRRLLEHAVDELPDSFRLVFMMRDIEGLSIEETAANLNIPPATVKTRLHRARRLLRQALDEKLGLVLRDTFPFDGARCARVADRVLARLGMGADDGS